MRKILINILFWLLGNTQTQSFDIQYLFGVSQITHEARRKKWSNALARIWRDKDFLDFMFYQAESDKENVFRGKISPDIAKGARIRTLFIIYSARRAFELSLKSNKKSPDDKEIITDEMKKVSNAYKHLVDVSED